MDGEDINDIKDQIINNRKDISELSINQYFSSLKVICKEVNIDIRVLSIKTIYNKINQIFDYLDNLSSYNNRITKLNALIAYSECSKLRSKTKDKLLNALYKKSNYEVKINHSLKYSKNNEVIDWNKVLKIHKEFSLVIKDIFTDDMSLTERLIVQNYVILSLLVLIEPRQGLDYVNIKIYNIKPSIDNHVVKIGNKKYLTIHNFKKQSKFSVDRIELPKQLVDIINKFSKNAPSDYLLCNKNLEQMSLSTLTKKINSIFDCDNMGDIGKISIKHLNHSYNLNSFFYG